MKENVYFGKIYNTTIYESEPIGDQPDLFLTNWHSQDSHSVFGDHNKTYLQN